jgi:hypothetical protein
MRESVYIFREGTSQMRGICGYCLENKFSGVIDKFLIHVYGSTWGKTAIVKSPDPLPAVLPVPDGEIFIAIAEPPVDHPRARHSANRGEYGGRAGDRELYVFGNAMMPPGQPVSLNGSLYVFTEKAIYQLITPTPKPWWRRALNWFEWNITWPVDEWMEEWDCRFTGRYVDRNYTQLDAAYNSAWFGTIHPKSIWTGRDSTTADVV